MSQEEIKFITVDECAHLLRVSRKTIYAMISEKRIPYRKVGSRVVFLLSEIVSWTQTEKSKKNE